MDCCVVEPSSVAFWCWRAMSRYEVKPRGVMTSRAVACFVMFCCEGEDWRAVFRIDDVVQWSEDETCCVAWFLELICSRDVLCFVCVLL